MTLSSCEKFGVGICRGVVSVWTRPGDGLAVDLCERHTVERERLETRVRRAYFGGVS